MWKSGLQRRYARCQNIFVHQNSATHLRDAKVRRNSEINKDNWTFNTSDMLLKFTRKKMTENVSVEDNRVKAVRKETQLDVNFELSDVPKSLIEFLKKHF